MSIIEKAKNKSFWAGVLTALAGLVGGSLSAPEFLINIINLIGGQEMATRKKRTSTRKKTTTKRKVTTRKRKTTRKKKSRGFLADFLNS